MGLLVMFAVVLLRDRPATSAKYVGAALAAAAAASAIVAARALPPDWRWLSLALIALSSSGPIAFWLWARAAFDAISPFGPGMVVFGPMLIAARLVVSCAIINGATASSLDRLLTLTDLVFAVLAVAQTVATKREDLVSRRRRLRVAVLIGTMAYIEANAAAKSSSVVFLALTSPVGNFSRALVLSLLAALTGWSVFRAEEAEPARLPAPMCQ